MDIIEEESNELKIENNNPIINFDLNNEITDSINTELPSTMQTPSQNNDGDNNIFHNKINDSKKNFEFKPYLSLKDESRFDDDLILEKEIKKLHELKTNYLSYQNDLSIKKRFILFDWIMQVCSQFYFKRKTYYSCLNLIELYFSKCSVSTNQIQLIGISCLLISAKNEETSIPQLSYFTMACDNSYSKNEIINQELMILKTLNWKIQYINLSDLGNLVTFKWDEIIKDLNKNSNNKEKYPIFRNDPIFKDLLLDHYFQFLDYISLDYFYNFVHEKYICVCVMYIIIGIAKKIFSYNDAFQFFNNINLINNEDFRIYQRFFFNFVKQNLKLSMVEILDVLKYVCIFCGIKFKPPFKGTYNFSSYEELTQLQTYNINNSDNFQMLKKFRENINLNV